MPNKRIGLSGFVVKPMAVTMKQTIKSLRRPITVLYPWETAEEREALRKNFRGQHAIDWEKCIGCSLCSRVCPNQCIAMEKIEIERYEGPGRSIMDEMKNVIKRPGVDIGHCLYCGNCEEYCPTDAWIFTRNCELSDYKRGDLVYKAEELKITGERGKILLNRIQENPILEVDKCIGCLRCERECPTRCISMVPGPKKRKGKPIPIPDFDYSICIGCSSCAEVCPTKCLTMEEV